jgi:hypothetical protein
VHASLTTVRGAGRDVAETARLAAESMLTWLRDFDGYRGLLVFADPGSGRARIMTLWESSEDLERSARGRAQVRESMVAAAGAEIESVEVYELVLDDRP